MAIFETAQLTTLKTNLALTPEQTAAYEAVVLDDKQKLVLQDAGLSQPVLGALFVAQSDAATWDARRNALNITDDQKADFEELVTDLALTEAQKADMQAAAAAQTVAEKKSPSTPFSFIGMAIAGVLIATALVVGILALTGVIPAIAAIGGGLFASIGTVVAAVAFVATVACACWQKIHQDVVRDGVPTQKTADAVISGEVQGHPDALQHMSRVFLVTGIKNQAQHLSAEQKKEVYAAAERQGLTEDERKPVAPAA